jgi:uncharacterized damage-inducible protein DinB
MNDYPELLAVLEPSRATNLAYTLHAELKHAEAMRDAYREAAGELHAAGHDASVSRVLHRIPRWQSAELLYHAAASEAVDEEGALRRPPLDPNQK